MSAIHLPLQRPAPGPASADAAPAGDPTWTRVLLVAGSRAALAVMLSLAVWSVLPAALGWSPRVIMSGSMMPRIYVGDVVVDRPVDPSTIKEGRIITVTDPDHPDKTRTHRLQEWNDSGQVVTKGDANDAPDSTPVDPVDVLGVAAIRVPFVGLPATWLAQGQLAPVGITVTVLLLLGLAATTPLRLAAADDTDDRDDSRDPDDTDGTGDPDDTDVDAGLGILAPAVAARRRDRLRADAPRRGGRVVATRSTGRRTRRVGVVSALVGAAVATLSTTGTTYAAFAATTQNPTSSFTAAASFSATAYFDAVRADSPQLYWRMDETSGPSVADSAVGTADTATLRGTFARGRSGALQSQPTSPAVGLTSASLVEDGVTNGLGPRFTIEAWVRMSATTTGGLVVGLGATGGPGDPSSFDRVMYVSPDGYLRLGLERVVVASSLTAVDDGRWHHVVGVLGGNGGGTGDAVLYVDGQQQGGVGRGKTTLNSGYWRVGAGGLAGWANRPTSSLVGDVDEVAVYPTALTGERVRAHYDAGS